MTQDSPSSGHARIDAADVSWVEVIDGGRRLCVRLRDTEGRPASMTLPVDRLDALLSALPRRAHRPAADGLATLSSWSAQTTPDGLVLILNLPDGAQIALSAKSCQLAAIASLVGAAPGPARLN